MKTGFTLVCGIVMLLCICFNLCAQNNIQSALLIQNQKTYSVMNGMGSIPPNLNAPCFNFMQAPTWYYATVCSPGLINIGISSASLSPFDSLSFMVFGPFNDTINIENQIVSSFPLTCETQAGPVGLLFFNAPAKGIYYILAGVPPMANVIDVNVFSTSSSNVSVADERCNICNGKISDLTQEICVIKPDQVATKNQIIWGKNDTTKIAGYTIFRENSIPNQFDSIGFVNKNSLSTYDDLTANPALHSWRYRIAGQDVCGHFINQVFASTFPEDTYSTLFLQPATTSGANINLNWSLTIPARPGSCCFTNSTYIYRGSSAANLVLLDSVINTVYTYSDAQPLAGINYYQVRAEKTSLCTPAIVAGGSQSGSNIINITSTSLSENKIEKGFIIYPNPAKNYLKIELKEVKENYSITLRSIEGKEILKLSEIREKEVSISLNGISAGVYITEIKSPTGSGFKKIIIE